VSRKWLITAGAALLAASALAGSATSSPAKHQRAAGGITLGFSQVGSESGWRTANTKSIQSSAKAAGINLKFSDAQQKQENQIAAIRSYIQQHVNVIAFSPVVESGWDAVLNEAKRAGIPVILTDRAVDSKDTSLYKTFIGSDFIKEGEMAGEYLAKAVNGKAKIIELQGTIGSSPANDRQKGFADYIKDHPDMQIIASQSGDFARDKGRQVFETLYQAHPEATALYSHNDEMTMGAIAAMEAAGKVPGKDLIIASIDGTKDAANALSSGKVVVVVECNPKFGPAAFAAVEKYGNGEKIEARLVNTDRVFTKDNVAAYLPEAY